MAIDFNKQLVFDPKIEIVGEEVPLAAMEKTGNVLQGRYDKSYEQYSMADEALKQMEASANPVDREKAKELRGIYNQEMQGILEKGDFHNMRQQTASLARNAAVNYKTIAERNQKIQSDLEALSKDPRYRLDPEGARKEYLSKISAVNINPETRTISDFNVTPYNAAADVNIAEKALKIAPTLRTKTRGGEDAKFVQQLFDGQPVWTKVSTSGKTEFLSADEINTELAAYLKTDPEIQSYIARDVGRMGLDINSNEGKAAYNQLLNDRITGSTTALANMYSVDTQFKGRDVGVIGGAKALGIGGDDDSAGSKYTPVTINNPLAPSEDRELSTDLTKSLAGDPKAVYSTRSIISSIIDNYTQKGDTKKAEKFTKYLNDITDLQNITQKYPDLVQYAKPDRLDNTGVLTIKEAVRTGKVKVSPEDKLRLDKISTDIGTAGKTTLEMNTWFDRELDDEYENFQSTGLRNIGMMQPDLVDDATRKKIESLSNGLNIDAFSLSDDAKKDWGEKKGLDIVSWSVEPVGSGVGIVFGIKNPKTDEIVYTTPKNRKADGLIQQVSKYLYSPAAIYDQMSNLPSPTRKTKVSSLLKTAQLPRASFKLDVNDEVDFQDGQYFTTSNPGKKYDSIYQLFYDNLNK
jgi:hypothetical protein